MSHTVPCAHRLVAMTIGLAASLCAFGAAASQQDGTPTTGDFARMDRGQGLPGRPGFESALTAPPAGWTSAWTSADKPDWQVAGSGHSRYERRDGKLVEVLDNRALNKVCTSEVEVRDDGFITLGCTGVPKHWVYVPTDAAYPFKVHRAGNGYTYRMGPARP